MTQEEIRAVQMLDPNRPNPSTVLLDVPSSALASNFVQVSLNSVKVGDREAIAKTAAPKNKPARETNAKTDPRARKLLGGWSVDDLYARACERWPAGVIEPFSLAGKAAGDGLVPIDTKLYIHNGMTPHVPEEPVTPDELPPSIDDFTVASDVADLPPQAAEAARYYADLQRQSGSYKIWQVCWTLILAYCLRWGRRALPMSPGTGIGILLHMARVGYSYGYIRNVRWTMSKAHKLARLPDPTLDDGFRIYLKLIAKELGTESKQRKAGIFLDHLRRMAELALSEGTLEALQEWTAMCLQWFSVLRRENLVGLNIEDFRRVMEALGQTARGYEVHIRRGKNHQDAPRDIFIGAIPQDPLICPVATVDRWIATLKANGYTYGPLFRHLGPAGVLTQKRLSGRTVARSIQHYTEALGLPPGQFATQSMRRGFITQALSNGVHQADLRQLTGHLRVESLDPYYEPGELAPNLSIAATYGIAHRHQLSQNIIDGAARPSLSAQVGYGSP